MDQRVDLRHHSGVVVLGMHRSGTSLAAELVHRWGAHGNEHSMLEPDEWNPRGYWEYRPLVEFNDTLLRAVKSSWRVPPWEEEERTVAALAQETVYRVRAFELLEEVRRGDRPWFWKDPRLTLLLPFWKQIWGTPAYLVPVRDPGAIADSLKRRDGLSYSNSLLLWQRYMSAILRDPDVGSAVLYFSYEDLLDDGTGVCRRICEFLDRQFGLETPDSDARVENMREAIDPELRRSLPNVPFSQSPTPTAAQQSLNRTLQLRTQGLRADVSEVVCPDRSWREHLLSDASVNPRRTPVNLIQVFWRSADRGYNERQCRSAALSEGSRRQSVRICIPPGLEDAPSGIRLDLGDRMGLMCIHGIAMCCTSGQVIWEWDGRPDSIQALPHNQAVLCEDQPNESGCMMELVGADPWLEIDLDASQSDALSGGGSVLLDCSYYSAAAIFARLSGLLSKLPQLEAQTSLVSEQLRSLSRLRELEIQTANLLLEQVACASRLTELETRAESSAQYEKLLSARAQTIEDQADSICSKQLTVSSQLQEVTARIELTKESVEAILQSRTWRMLTRLGGILLNMPRKFAKRTPA